MERVLKVGILALQGAVAEHKRSIEKAGAEAILVKRVEQLSELDGLILPGGESTTIGRLMRHYGFMEAIPAFYASGKAIFGTCAGLILLADHIESGETAHLRLMDMTVMRNAFGRQRESFETDLKVAGVADDLRAVFIRAPLITSVGSDVEVLAMYQDEIVVARQERLLAASFHPELTEDDRLHRYFLDIIKATV
ncbi:pyridoxal 5'-phosphate synthase glutaminase subunit PdxT [Paenibacillus yanchengensis]|uniref:Pyridoxal 5'-phosphate synthase subunit PdxT n=1 Tax=Paenibacillus yanchengensis TaxID=2035833 RepID=A0ABW4YMZ0_9BACL